MDISFLLLVAISGIVIVIIFGFARMIFGASQSANANDSHWENPFYSLKNGEIFYGGRIPIRADMFSFRPLDYVHPYAMDKDTIFFKGKVLPSHTPENFRYIGRQGKDLYSADAKNVFLNATKISDALPESFILFPHTNFTRDSHTIYFNGKKIPDAHSETFQVMEGEYARDKNGYFLRCSRIQSSQIPHSLLSDTFSGLR